MSHVSLLQLLNASNFLCLNRDMIKAIGLHETIMLSEICDKYDYFFKSCQLQDKWFYLTVDSVEERTTLSRFQQESAIKKLIKLEFIQIKVFGLPAKRHFLINEEKIMQFLGFSNTLSRTLETSELEGQKLANKDARNSPAYIDKRTDLTEQNKDNNNKPIRNENPEASKVAQNVVVETEKIIYQDRNKQLRSITRSEIFRHFLKFAYPPELITRAIQQFQAQNKLVGNPLKLIEAIALSMYNDEAKTKKFEEKDDKEKIKEQEKEKRRQENLKQPRGRLTV